jgi:hypothetical protein
VIYFLQYFDYQRVHRRTRTFTDVTTARTAGTMLSYRRRLRPLMVATSGAFRPAFNFS